MLLPRLIVCFIVGIVCADLAFEAISEGTLVLFSCATCAFLLSVLLWRGGRMFCISLAFAFFLLGSALLVNERVQLRTEWSEEKQVYCATNITDIREKAKHYQVTATVDSHRVRLTLQRDSLSPVPNYGGTLFIYTRLQPPRNFADTVTFDYARYLLRQGISGTGFCKTEDWRIAENTQANPIVANLLEVRKVLSQRLERHLDGMSLEVVSAMTLGNKQLLTQETRRVYSETGASHVLALSGLHLGIIFALFNLLFLRPLRAFRIFCKCVQVAFILAMWAFVFMAGAPLSLLRAAVMLTLIQLGILFQRGSLSLHNMSIAALVLLIWSPQSLFDVGFQLSFMAVLSILLLTPYLPRKTQIWQYENLRWHFKRWCLETPQDLLRVSLSAQIGTLPLVLYYFHLMPTYSLLISLWVIPWAGIVLSLALLFFLFPFAETVLGSMLSESVSMMNGGLEYFSALPFATLEMPITLPTVLLLYLLPPFIIWGLGHYKRRITLIVGIGIIILSIGIIEMCAR